MKNLLIDKYIREHYNIYIFLYNINEIVNQCKLHYKY